MPFFHFYPFSLALFGLFPFQRFHLEPRCFFRFQACLFFGLHFRQSGLFFAQFGFLSRDQFGLAARFLCTPLSFGFVDDRRNRFSLFYFRTESLFVPFDKCPFFSDLNLDRAGFAGGISLLDFARLLAGQRNFTLFSCRYAMCTAQIAQQFILVFLAQGVVD